MHWISLRDEPSEVMVADDFAGRVGRGDRLAFGELYLQHHEAAWGMASVASGFSADAEIALIQGVAAAFVSMPARDEEIRSHVLAEVRRVALERPARIAPVALDGNPVRRFLRLLPEHWRSALWLSRVEDLPADEVAPILGVEPASVPIVASLAWEAVRGGCLDSYQRVEAPAQCRPSVDRIGPYLSGELAAPEQRQFEAHCEDCAACGLRLAELDPILGLLGALAPNPLLGAEAQHAWLTALHRQPTLPSDRSSFWGRRRARAA